MKRLMAVCIILFVSQPFQAQAVGQFEEISSLPKREIFLFAKEHERKYEGFELQVGKQAGYFPKWKSMKGAKPTIKELDVNGDNQTEIIVLLPQRKENNIFINEAKVIEKGKGNRLTELLVYDARKILLSEVKYYMDQKNFYVQLHDRDVLKLKNQKEPPELSVNSYVLYEVDRSGLKAKINLNSNKGEKLGTFELRYKNKNTKVMEPDEMVFKQK